MRKPAPLSFHWETMPFVRLVLPLMLGILTFQYFPSSQKMAFGLLLIASLFLWLLANYRIPNSQYRWMPGLLILICFWVLGYMLAQRQWLAWQPDFKMNDEPITLVGTLTRHPVSTERSTRLLLNITAQMDTTGQLQDTKGKLQLYLRHPCPSADLLKVGSRIIVKTRIQPVPPPKNPHAFDYRAYLAKQGIYYQAFATEKQIRVISASANSFFSLVALGRQKGQQILKQYIVGKNEYAIASALLLGTKSELGDELKEVYTNAGAIHVLAVSGLHVGIISFLFLGIFSRIPFLQHQKFGWLTSALVIMVIWGYALLTGLSPSVLRAATMFTIIHIGLSINRITNIYNSLAIAAFLILVFSPYSLFYVGFQFSFLAVLGIAFFGTRLLGLFPDLSMIPRYFWQVFSVSIGAQIGVLPLSLYYFHEFASYFWLSSLVVILAAKFILTLAILLLVAATIHTTIAQFIGYLLDKLIGWQNYLLSLIEYLPFHQVSGFWLHPGQVILIYLAIGIVGGIILNRRLGQLRLVLGCFAFIFLTGGFQQIHQKKQKEIVVYSLSKNSVIDFVDGQTIYSLVGDPSDTRQIRYSTQSYRWYLGAKEIIPVESKKIEYKSLFRNNEFFQFFDKKLVILDQNTSLNKNTTQPFPCDYILLQNNPELDWDVLQKMFQFKEIWMDGSNSYQQVQQWKKELEEKGILYRDIKNEQAQIIKL